MESLAAAYGWSPATIADLTLDELELWAKTAEARLKSRPTCPWLSQA